MPARAVSHARYLLEKPDAKVALFYQNDDFGKGFVNGFREALGDARRDDRLAAGQL